MKIADEIKRLSAEIAKSKAEIDRMRQMEGDLVAEERRRRRTGDPESEEDVRILASIATKRSLIPCKTQVHTEHVDELDLELRHQLAEWAQGILPAIKTRDDKLLVTISKLLEPFCDSLELARDLAGKTDRAVWLWQCYLEFCRAPSQLSDRSTPLDSILSCASQWLKDWEKIEKNFPA